jgi:CBS domain containing-hemolysin-like protein
VHPSLLLASWSPSVFEVLMLLAIPVLIALNGVFVAAEFSLVAVRHTRIEELVRQGVPGAVSVEQAIKRLDRSIAATQLGVTLSSLALGWVGEEALARLMDPLFGFLPEHWAGVGAHGVATGIAFVAIVFLQMVFGELVPKTVAIQTADTTALWLARPFNAFAKLTRPLTRLMSWCSYGVIRLLGLEPSLDERLVHSVAELELLIEDTEEAGLLDPDQAEYVQNVFQLSGKKVQDCLVPRDKMAVLEVSTPQEKILEAVRGGAHTRMPVYEGTLDNIVGVVNTKDLFYLFSLKGVVVLQDALYLPLFIKPEQRLGEALRLFRRAKRPMAIVRDDDGKVHGLITLEDVLEEIVGEIEDEHDQSKAQRQRWQGRLLIRRRAAAPKPQPNAKPQAAEAALARKAT